MNEEKKVLTEEEKLEVAKDLAVINAGFLELSTIREMFYAGEFSENSKDFRDGMEFIFVCISDVIEETSEKLGKS